jgi:hypothetical protein
VIPSFLAVTEPLAYIRFHGRNREHWLKWAYLIFNNCYRNFGVTNAITMAQMLR